jgi:aryl-alcohol dehydrogenase-like predicted oxidoreductase
MAQIALAWSRTDAIVCAPMFGATPPHHLTEAAAAPDLQLMPDEVPGLEAPGTTAGPSWL